MNIYAQIMSFVDCDRLPSERLDLVQFGSDYN